jgi:DNA-binding response OmpR family regulator
MMKVLLVEAYETTRRATTMLLRSSGYEVIGAASGTEALRLVYEERPQLVLLDVNLPDLSGIEVCRQIKANPATATTLVLEISGHYTGSGDKARGLDSGADGYLIKPVETSELLATIRALFRLHAAEGEARRMRLRAEASAARFRGLGLGLAVVRHLVELHGGSVAADSAGEGQGATFIVRLPVIATRKELSPDGEQIPELQDQSRTLTLFDPTLLSGVSVLVVEPDSLARELIEYTLSRCGATLRTAATIDEALTLFATWSPDLVIADAELPDGEKLMRRTRVPQTDSGHSLPAVGIISSNTFYARVRALAAGFMLHLARPVLPDELITVAASLVGRLSSSRPASQRDAKGIRSN